MLYKKLKNLMGSKMLLELIFSKIELEIVGF